MKRDRVSFRIRRDLVEETRRYAEREGIPLCEVVEGALKEFLSDERDQTALQGLLSVCSRTERRVRGLRVDLETVSDLLSYFFLHWFCHTTPIPESVKREAFAQGQGRYTRFMELFREGRHSGKVLSEEQSKDTSCD